MATTRVGELLHLLRESHREKSVFFALIVSKPHTRPQSDNIYPRALRKFFGVEGIALIPSCFQLMVSDLLTTSHKHKHCPESGT